MSFQNRASWLTAKQSPVNVVSEAPYTSPIANELVIKTKAIALNPADVGVQALGILLNEYPAILGCDVAGEVVEVDPSLADSYKVGDRVTGPASCTTVRDGKYCYSGFQEYVILKAPQIAKIPAHVSFQDASVLPLGINTAASSLFSEKTLGLGLPRSPAAASVGKTLLVWGASSSVGACGVQLAAQAGYEVIAVASQKNHELVKSLGAAAVFDHNDADIVDHIVKYVAGSGKEVVGAFSSIADGPVLETLCETLDKISTTTTTSVRKLVSSVMPGAEEKASKGVAIVTNFATFLGGNDFTTPVWEWLQDAMAQDTVKYAPPSEVVGNGLEDVQQGVDLLAKGVSAKKLVVLV
jgi:NADPH:quinone reductase-like Zn-dependent oxidoreductase